MSKRTDEERKTVMRRIEGLLHLDRNESEQLVRSLMNPDEDMRRRAEEFIKGVELIEYDEAAGIERYEIPDLDLDDLFPESPAKNITVSINYHRRDNCYVSSLVRVSNSDHGNMKLEDKSQMTSNMNRVPEDERMLIA